MICSSTSASSTVIRSISGFKSMNLYAINAEPEQNPRDLRSLLSLLLVFLVSSFDMRISLVWIHLVPYKWWVAFNLILIVLSICSRLPFYLALAALVCDTAAPPWQRQFLVKVTTAWIDQIISYLSRLPPRWKHLLQ